MAPLFDDPTAPVGSSGRPLSVTQDQLTAIVSHFGPRVVPAGTADEVNAVVALAGVGSHLELAHFVAQCAYECARFTKYVEPPVAGRYEGRIDLGNVNPGDGQAFRGRGAIQLTGRHNYTAFNEWLRTTQNVPAPAGVNVVATPEIVGEAPFRWLAAAFFWSSHPLLKRYAQNDDVSGCTRVITGALVPDYRQGLDVREAFTNKAIEVLG